MASTPPPSADAEEEVFDYIIIGGGTAGLVVAARLSEDPSVHVLVLEAGDERLDDPKINIPGMMNNLYGDNNYDWNFHTTPQPHLNDRIIAWPRGKVLGGSSAINYLMASYASKVDIDNWERLGNPGWNFEALEPYFRKAESYLAPEGEVEDGAAARPLKISLPKGTGVLDQAWSPTLQGLGLGADGDPRDGKTLGGYSIPKFQDNNAKRSYSAPAYYLLAKERENLIVLTGAFVQKIEFITMEDVVTATGVRYLKDGEARVVKVKIGGEVILSAGTVQSPQILELSGIGERARLEKLGIEVVLDNPNVGENLQDHLLMPFAYEAQDGIPTREMIKQLGVLDWALDEYTTNGAGPLAGGVTGTAFLSLASIVSSTEHEVSQTRLLELLEETPVLSHPELAKQLALQKEQIQRDSEADIQYIFGASGMNKKGYADVSQFFEHDDPGGYAGIVTVLTHALSRGSIHIESTDPKVHPLIDPRYMSHPLDLEILSSGLLFTQTIASSPPLSHLLKNNPDKTGKQIQPSFGIPTRLTKEAAVRLVRESSATSFHPVGTCSMLPLEEGGVVDARLKVWGVRGLRVVDASVIPLNVRGNIASAVFAIAERAGDLIKEDRAK